MKRRSFIKKAAVTSTAAAASTIAAPAISQGIREWRLVTSWPKGLPGVGTGAERMAKNIERLSGGRLRIKVYAAGELVPALGVFDAVSSGTAQLGHDPAYYHLNKSEACAFFCAFPWGFTSDEMNAWILHGNGQKLWDELYAPFGMRAFLAGNTCTQMLGWFKEEINTVEDFQGLKFRAPGNQAKVLQKLGGVAVQLAGGEVFQALQSGSIDAAEWIGPYNDLSLGFYQVCKYYYSHGYHEPGPALQLTVNEEAWSTLPDDLKGVLQAAAAQANTDITSEYNAGSGPALRSLVQDHGVIVKPLPEDVIKACGEKTNEVITEIYEAGEPIVRKVIEDFFTFRKTIMPWSRISQQAYLNARSVPEPFKIPGVN